MNSARRRGRPRHAVSVERRAHALGLRKEGATYERIGRTLGISTQAAYKHVEKALIELQNKTAEDVDAVRTLEVQRLDQLMRAFWRRAIAGDEAALDRVLKLMERRAKLLGLDSPAKIAPTDPDGEKPYEPIPLTESERADRILALLGTASARRAAEVALRTAEGGTDTE